MTSSAGVKARVVRRRSPQLREELFESVLPCGLRVVILPKPGFDQRTAIVATRYGSLDLDFETSTGGGVLHTPPGIAHFLEHQLFKKEGGHDLLADFGRTGASSNAYTDYTTTTYYFSVSRKFPESLDLLLRLAFEPWFQSEYVAKEKLIIEQELRMYEDMPDHRAYRALMEALYREHPVRIDIGGSVESIQKIDTALLERCYRMFYHPSNMTFAASGDLDPREIIEALRRALPPEKFRGERVTGRRLPVEPAGVGQPRVELSLGVARPRVMVGIKDLCGDDYMTRDLEMSAVVDLLFGRSSPFYSRAYESGLIDDSFSASYSSEPEFGFLSVGGETDEPERLEREIRRLFESASRGRFRRQDVERSRRKMIGRHLRSFDTPDQAAFMILGYRMRGLDPFETPRRIQGLRASSLQRRLKKVLRPENLAVSVVMPKGTPPEEARRTS